MKGIDTNILIRFLTGDDVQQAKRVYDLFKNAEAQKNEFFVPLLVLLELIWVLESVYEIPRAALLDSINDLTLMPILKFEQHAAVQQFFMPPQKTAMPCPICSLPIPPGSQGATAFSPLTKKQQDMLCLSWHGHDRTSATVREFRTGPFRKTQ